VLFLHLIAYLSPFSQYPIFVAVFWVLEHKCVGSDPFMLSLSSDSLSPLIGCMFAARYHLLVVVVAWLAVVSGKRMKRLLSPFCGSSENVFFLSFF
jgi:hypothetical protein